MPEPTVAIGDEVRGAAVLQVGARSGLAYTNPEAAWAEELEALELASYPTADPVDLYDAPHLRVLTEEFGHGCFVGFDTTAAGGPALVAMGLGVQVVFDLANPIHTIGDIVPDDGDGSGSDPDGEWYYGTGISVRPEYRRRGIGGELYELRKSVCQRLNLRGIVAGGVMPGYAEHREAMSADAYITKVVSGELYDPTLTFQQDSGFTLGPALPGYITDPAVDNYACLIVWHNPGFTP